MYSFDAQSLWPWTSPSSLSGRSVLVDAAGPNGEMGWNTGLIDNSMPYMEIDVTLS